MFIIIAAFAASPYASTALAGVVGIPLLLLGVNLCLSFVAASLLFGQFSVCRRWPLLFAGSAFSYLAFMTIADLLAFPGVFSSHRIIGNEERQLWIWLAGHAGFLVMVVGYIFTTRFQRPLNHASGTRILIVAVVLIDILLAVGTTLSILRSSNFALTAHLGTVALSASDICTILLLQSATTLIYAAATGKNHGALSIFNLWFLVVLLSVIIDLSLHIAGHSTFTVGSVVGTLIGTIILAFFVSMCVREIGQVTSSFETIAHFDPLTGLANRRSLDLFLSQFESENRRSVDTFAAMMIDVDHFKAFNDHFGHLAGDLVLQAIGQVIRISLGRPKDLGARYGGEEFAVILPSTDRIGALAVARRIRQDVEKLKIPHIVKKGYVTVSIGIANSGQENAVDPRSLLSYADRALYHAKASGRNVISEASAAQDGRFRVHVEDLASA
ncbi:MAG TPA: diguanylate cyclase [Candidatus Baltobacteraceae bacterium]|nr:diguanylate cyclase [Candidatus Baltobacteraceae bacterium]